MKCYSSEHLMWCFLLGAPGLIIWGVGIPVSAFVILYKNRNNLEDPEIKKYYLMIYQGLKPNRFYWEFVNTARKVLILSLNVFLARVQLFYRIASIVVLLFVFFRVQLKQNPYNKETNNSLERVEVIAGMFTIFGGILFIEDEGEVELIGIITFISILVVNSYFLTLWSYYMLCTFRNTHRAIDIIANLLAMALRIKTLKEQEFLTPQKYKKTRRPTKRLRPKKTGYKKKRFQREKLKLEQVAFSDISKIENNSSVDNIKNNFQSNLQNDSKSFSKSKYQDDSVAHEDNFHSSKNEKPSIVIQMFDPEIQGDSLVVSGSKQNQIRRVEKNSDESNTSSYHDIYNRKPTIMGALPKNCLGQKKSSENKKSEENKDESQDESSDVDRIVKPARESLPSIKNLTKQSNVAFFEKLPVLSSKSPFSESTFKKQASRSKLASQIVEMKNGAKVIIEEEKSDKQSSGSSQ